MNAPQKQKRGRGAPRPEGERARITEALRTTPIAEVARDLGIPYNVVYRQYKRLERRTWARSWAQVDRYMGAA